MNVIKYLVFIVFCSCNQPKTKPENTVKINISAINTTSRIDTTINYNKEKLLNNYVKEIIDSLRKNKIPDFVNDECLDASTMGYCSVSSHETISLRTDIIKRLSRSDIEKILQFGNKEKLKKKCKTDFSSELLNSEKSTYDILVEATQ